MASSKKKKYKLSLPRFLTIVGAFILIIALIIILSVSKSSGSGSNSGAIALPSEAVANVDPLATASPSPSPTATPTPTIPPTASPVPQLPTFSPTPLSTATPVPTASPTPGLKKDPNALKKPTSAMKKKAATGVVSGNNVNLRQGPSTSTPIVVEDMKRNEELTVYPTDGNFYFVKVNRLGKYGYISKKYVKLTSAFGETAKATPTAKPTGTAPAGTVTGKVTASKVALRSGPSSDSSCINEYSSGQTVYIHYKEDDFYYVTVPGSKKNGYMYAKYVKASGDVPKKK